MSACPRCSRTNVLEKYRIIRLSLYRWPEMLIGAGIILIARNYLNCPEWAVYLAMGIASLPLIFSTTQRSVCGVCGIDFENAAPLTQIANSKIKRDNSI